MELDESNLIKREDMTVPKMHLSELPTWGRNFRQGLIQEP